MSAKKILIVEDDPDVLLSMHVRLRAHHYDTYSASDAITCMAEARRVEPDLIILDLGLPAGDGFVLMERFNKVPSLAAVPVIVVSGRDLQTNQKKVIALGGKAFLQKPVSNAHLLAVIRSALGEQRKTEASVVYHLGSQRILVKPTKSLKASNSIIRSWNGAVVPVRRSSAAMSVANRAYA